MEIKELHRLFIDSAGVTTDSRVDSSGRIFFALQGEIHDGHTFVSQALNNGCSMAVIDNDEFAIPGKTIMSNNVLRSLQHLACFHRQQFSIPVLAITGSNGKTTTKELIRDILSVRYDTLATRGNLNNHIGVPLTLLGLNGSHHFAVIEMGANHIGEIDQLCNIAMPDHGLITNIGNAHLEGFGSPAGVRKAKSELFRYLRKTGGRAFLNTLRPELIEISGEIPLGYIPFGRDRENFLSGEITGSGEYLEIEIRSKQFSETFNLKTCLTGAYNFENVLAAVCTGIYFGVSPERVKEAIEKYIPANNRSQILQTDSNKLVLDAYNANPDSMKAALTNFFSLPGNKSVILGDMFELGRFAPEEHKKIIDLLVEFKCREAFLVGSEFCKAGAGSTYHLFPGTNDLISWISQSPPRNRHILIKGSRGMQLEKCIEFL